MSLLDVIGYPILEVSKLRDFKLTTRRTFSAPLGIKNPWWVHWVGLEYLTIVVEDKSSFSRAWHCCSRPLGYGKQTERLTGTAPSFTYTLTGSLSMKVEGERCPANARGKSWSRACRTSSQPFSIFLKSLLGGFFSSLSRNSLFSRRTTAIIGTPVCWVVGDSGTVKRPRLVSVSHPIKTSP